MTGCELVRAQAAALALDALRLQMDADHAHACGRLRLYRRLMEMAAVQSAAADKMVRESERV